MPGSRFRKSPIAEIFALGLFLAYVILLFAHRAAPSLTDYANWTYQGALLRQHLLGHPDPAHWLKPYPVPNSAATLGIGLLSLVLSWQIAAKVWLCLQLGLSYAALRHLMQTVQGSAAAWWIVPQAVFLNVNFWYGFMNFELGLCWVLLTASLLLRRTETTGQSDWPLGLLLLAAFFTHMIPFAFCGLLLLLYSWQTRRLRVLWQLLPSSIVGLWYVAGRFLLAANADGQAGMQAHIHNYSAAFWAFKADSYLKSFGMVNPLGRDSETYGQPAYVALFLVNAILALLLGGLLLRSAWHSHRQRKPDRFLWYGVALLVPVYLLAPGEALGVSDPGARLLQVALALALVLGLGAVGRATRAAALCSGVLSVSGLYLFSQFGFQPRLAAPAILPHLPAAIRSFTMIPNNDQDYFYAALERGDWNVPVFPTGMFLNQTTKAAPVNRGGLGFLLQQLNARWLPIRARQAFSACPCRRGPRSKSFRRYRSLPSPGRKWYVSPSANSYPLR